MKYKLNSMLLSRHPLKRTHYEAPYPTRFRSTGTKQATLAGGEWFQAVLMMQATASDVRRPDQVWQVEEMV
jgi:hypothetical protein